MPSDSRRSRAATRCLPGVEGSSILSLLSIFRRIHRFGAIRHFVVIEGILVAFFFSSIVVTSPRVACDCVCATHGTATACRGAPRTPLPIVISTAPLTHYLRPQPQHSQTANNSDNAPVSRPSQRSGHQRPQAGRQTRSGTLRPCPSGPVSLDDHGEQAPANTPRPPARQALAAVMTGIFGVAGYYFGPCSLPPAMA